MLVKCSKLVPAALAIIWSNMKDDVCIFLSDHPSVLLLSLFNLVSGLTTILCIQWQIAAAECSAVVTFCLLSLKLWADLWKTLPVIRVVLCNYSWDIIMGVYLHSFRYCWKMGSITWSPKKCEHFHSVCSSQLCGSAAYFHLKTGTHGHTCVW